MSIKTYTFRKSFINRLSNNNIDKIDKKYISHDNNNIY